MCGFFVVFDFNCSLKKYSSEITRAGELLSHRGPDDSGIYIDNDVGMYFRRLSIIDLSEKAHQPFFSSDNDMILVFNGEIYNYKEIRASLITKGHKFYSSSDTEVLMRAYEEYGNECVNEFRGMFSFAIWNKKKKLLTLARDRFGIKPLYIYRNKNQVVISSEIKSILFYAPESKEPDEKSMVKFVARTFADDTTDTFYKNIKSIPPANIVEISPHRINTYRYWDLEYKENNSFKIDDFRQTFEETMAFHVRSDVAVAATLSGGMDSSSIVGVISKLNLVPSALQTFSVFPPETYDESFWIDKVVDSSNVQHEYINLNLDNMPQIIDEIILSHDEPFQYSSCIYQYMLRERIAEKNIKVLLVGEGADEVLAGYRRIFFSYILALYGRRNIDEFLTALMNSKSLFNYDSLEKIIGGVSDYLNVIRRNQSGQENQSYMSLLNSEMIRKYSDIINLPLYINNEEDPEENFFELLKKHIFVRNLPYVLRMEDRNSMAKGVEARVPFLDHVFVEKVFSHDFSEFMKGGTNKSMLRRAMNGYIPAEVLDRKNKTNRPGNHAHLVYKLMREEISDILESDVFSHSSLWKTNLTNIFIEDVNCYNTQTAEVWFRLYIVSRWLQLLDYC